MFKRDLGAQVGFKVRQAVTTVLDPGLRTKDIWSEGMILASTDEIGTKIAESIY